MKNYISSSDEGFSYVDTFPVASAAGGTVSNAIITNNNTVGDDPTYQDLQNVTIDNSGGILNIYPDNIRANNGTDGVVTVTYDFTVHTTVQNEGTVLTNTVCASYFDSSTMTSVTSDTDCSSEMITAPVTLASFFATHNDSSDDIMFNWSTATETANLGFNLYVVLGQTRFPLNRKLIASKVNQSTQLTSYTARIPAPMGGASRTFYIEDVDMMGARQMHGPFYLNQSYGNSPDEAMSKKIDWTSITAETANKKQQRRTLLSQQHQQRTHQRHAPMVRRHATSAQDTPTGEHLAIKLQVHTAGVYRITYEELVALGLNLQGYDPATIALQSGGLSIPHHISPRGTSEFGPGSYIEFIGKPAHNLYSHENVYLLTLNGEDRGVPIRSAQSYPRGKRYSGFYMAHQTLTSEQVYSFASPLPNDPWHDAWLLAIDAPNTRHYAFDLDGLASTAEVGVTIDATIVGGVDWPEDQTDHHVLLSLNDQFATQQKFDGIHAAHLTAEMPIDLIGERDNSIAITLPADNVKGIDAVHIDAIDIQYPRKYMAVNDTLSFTSNDDNFKIVGFSEPTMVVYAENRIETLRLRHVKVASDSSGYSVAFRGTRQETTYYVVTDQSVLSASLELIERHDITHTVADHLIIAHPDFMGQALDEYVAERKRWSGGSHQVIDVRDIYANYSHHLVDAEAIKQFITDVSTRSTLQSVLLVGGDTYDYHHRLDSQSVSFVPTLYRATDRIVQFSPVDAAYGDLDEDRIPEIAVGRLPVRNSAEFEMMTRKLVEHQSLPSRKSAVLVADDFQATEGYHFAQASNLLYPPLDQDGWSVTRLHLANAATAPQLRQSLIGALNQGPALTVFTGHSGPQQWTFDGIFSSGDAASLTNEGQATTVIQWGCWNTYFVEPKAQTLGHRFLLSGNQGAANVVGASTLTVALHERELSQFLTKALLSGEAIGQALNRAKQQYAEQFGPHADVMLGINLLGDPLSSVK